jgi:hypothetical protein
MTDFSTLRPVAEGLWTVDGNVSVLGAPFPARMTVMRAGDGLWLYSPCPIADPLAERLAAFGEVVGIITPNRFHHLFAAAARKRYPKATLFGSEGLARKRSDLAFDQLLHGESLALAGDALAVVTMRGVPAVSEAVVFHRPSRSLVVADLIFNVTDAASLRTRLTLKTTGTYGRPAASRVWSWALRDRVALQASVDVLAGWHFERIVMAHGEVLEDAARERLGRALSERLKVTL